MKVDLSDPPNDTSLGVLLLLGEGISEVEEAAGRHHNATPCYGCTQHRTRYTGHQDPT